MAEGRPFISSGKLFDYTNAFQSNIETDELFTEAVNEALQWHISHCNIYKLLLAENGLIDFKYKYLPEDIPPLLNDFFKDNLFLSVPEKQIKFEIISYNNSNNRLVLDAKSYKRIIKIYENIFKSFDLVNHNQKVNYICLTSDSKLEKNQNENFFFNIISDLTAHRSVYYALKKDNITNELIFNIEDTAKKIIDFSCHQEPVRIIGSSFFLRHILDWFEEHEIKLKLVKNSFCFILDNKNLFRKYYYLENKLKKDANKYLGIIEDNYRNIIILPEQGIPFVSCKCGRNHIPIFSKALILDPESLIPVEDGTEGLLAIISPYLTSYPAISILTNIKAVLKDNCPCGLSGKTLTVTDVFENTDDPFYKFIGEENE